MTHTTYLGPEKLPPELAELDVELSSIRYEERPSFAPELEAELAREWTELQGRRSWRVDTAVAAALAGLLLVGVGVPSARAALVRFVGSLAALVERTPAASQPSPLFQLLLSSRQGDAPDSALPSRFRPPAEPPPGASGADRYAVLEATPPELLDRDRAAALILRNYPLALQKEGVGGVVGVLLWVDSTGTVGFVNLGESSGVPDLDRAALQVAPLLRFQPARRQGRAVATWVEFDVRFEPSRERDAEDEVSGAAPGALRGRPRSR